MALKSNENIDKYVENFEDVKGNNNNSNSDNDTFDKYEKTSNSKNIIINSADQMDIDEEFDNNKNDNTSNQPNHDDDGETIRFPDINQIVDIYPKTISYQFPLLLLLIQSKTKQEGNTTTIATKVT
nr:12503_t:CDS:2 [Entrophospora candida]